MKGISQLRILLSVSITASAACLALIETKPARAFDNAKCDLLGNEYAELKAYRDAKMEAVPGWVDESNDPDRYRKWRTKLIQAGEPYDAK